MRTRGRIGVSWITLCRIRTRGLKYGENGALVVLNDCHPPVGDVEGRLGDAAAEPLDGIGRRVAVGHGEVAEEVAGHLGGERVRDDAAPADRGVGARFGARRGPHAEVDAGFRRTRTAGVVELRGGEAEGFLVERVDPVLLPRVDLGPAEGTGLVLLLEALALTGLPEAEYGTAGVRGLGEHAGPTDPDGVGDHLSAVLADPGDGSGDVVGGEVDAPGGRHPAVLLGGEGGDQPPLAEGVGEGAVAGAEGPAEELTVEALARFEVGELHIHPARGGLRECGHGPGSFRLGDAHPS